MDFRSMFQDPGNQWSSNTQVFFPNDPQFASSTERWNAYERPTYKAAVRPGSAEDVQKIIKLAASNEFPFLVTGGNHGYSATFGTLDDGLAIDMRNFNSVTINAAANTMTIGGGTIFNQIFDPLYNAGKEIQSGACSTVGVLGITLGGGVGRYQGIHGLLLDALQSVRMVTAKGDLITVSSASNSDLFWGLRGAGMNFGAITEATYRVRDLTNGGQVRNADLIFPVSAAPEFFKALQSFKAKQPKEMACIALVICDNATGEAQILVNFTFPGPEDEFMKLIQPFLDLNPATQVINTLPWNELVTKSGFGIDALLAVKGQPHSIFASNLKNIDSSKWVEIFNRMNDFYASTPAARTSAISLEIYSNEAVAAVPDDATAYPWRDAQAYVMFQMGWTDPSATNAANALAIELRNMVVSTSGYSGLTTYVSYAHGDETLEQKYGANKLPRLQALKKKWDPKNVFAYNNAIVPST